MVVRKILLYDNPILRKKCKPVNAVSNEVKKLINDMANTMYANNGVGLAANQIGELLKVIVVDISEERNELLVFINPKITKKEGSQLGVEACLSVPKFEGEVDRSQKIWVKAKNIFFEDLEMETDGYLAVALQHEIDHLSGILYTDKVPKGKLKATEDHKSPKDI